MIKQTRQRSCRGGRIGLFVIVIGGVSIALSGCAELELGVEVYKNIPRVSNVPPARPVLYSSPQPDKIELSMRADPQAFRATGLGLWDGSQTLPGVWIAHPSTDVARRVRLTNSETGTRVDAAMFRRDPNLSGPQLIVSSEAAKLLGLTPGHGTPITVEGLAYRTDFEAGVEVSSTDEQPTPAAGDVAAIAAVEPGAAPDATGSEALPIAADVVLARAPEVVAEPDPGFVPVPVPEDIPVSVPPEAPQMATVADSEPVPVIPVEVSAGLDNAVAAKEPQDAEIDARLAVILPPPRPVARSVRTASNGPGDIVDGRKFIQAGVFSQPENATRLVAALRAADLPASERPVTLGERQLTRVLIGPFQTITERDAALEVIRRIGPSDATPSPG